MLFRNNQNTALSSKLASGVEERDFFSGLSPQEKQILYLREDFAERAFIITICWLIFLCFVTVAQLVLPICRWGNRLESSEFIALVTTTSATVFGFWYVVGRSLFPFKDKKEKNSSEKP